LSVNATESPGEREKRLTGGGAFPHNGCVMFRSVVSYVIPQCQLAMRGELHVEAYV
jgi:hypothetical protein